MACDLQTTLTAACSSGIAKLNSPIELLQVIAQTLCSAEGGDPYDGLLVYSRQGLPDTTVVGPVGAYNLNFGANEVTAIHCHNCPLITGLTCYSPLLTVLDLENCSTMANLDFDDCTALTSVNLDTFTSFSGVCSFHTCSSLSSFSAVNLVSTGGRLDLILTAVVNQSFPSLLSTGLYFGCSGSSLLTVSTPTLTDVGDSYYVANSPLLVSVSAPALEILISGIYAGDCPSLVSMDFDLLLGTSFIEIQDNANLSSVLFSSVQYLSSLDFSSCTTLADISFPSFAGVTPYVLNGPFCTNLAILDFPGAICGDGASLNLAGCALAQTYVDAMIQSLTDGANTSTFLDMTGGTSSAPDATHIAQAVVLNGLGCTVTHN